MFQLVYSLQRRRSEGFVTRPYPTNVYCLPILTEKAPPSFRIPGFYCWFSHEVTKIQTKKLSILPRFYFHDALEQPKTNFHTNFRFKRVLGFVIEDV